ncbi:hypothetical protein [Microcoleus sp. F10B5]
MEILIAENQRNQIFTTNAFPAPQVPQTLKICAESPPRLDRNGECDTISV